jgi:hypothetical protein
LSGPLGEDGQDAGTLDDQIRAAELHITNAVTGVHSHYAGAMDDRVMGREAEDRLQVLGDDPRPGESVELVPAFNEQDALPLVGQQLSGPEPRARRSDYYSVISSCHASPIFHAY